MAAQRPAACSVWGSWVPARAAWFYIRRYARSQHSVRRSSHLGRAEGFICATQKLRRLFAALESALYASALLVVAQPLHGRQITNPERTRLPLPLTGCDSPGLRSVRARSPPTAQEQCRSRLRAEGLLNHGSAFFSRCRQRRRQ